MLSRLAIRRIASANIAATDTTSIFGDRAIGWVSTLSVMYSRSIGLASSRSHAGPASTPWLTAANTRSAPLDEQPSRVAPCAGGDGEVVDDQRGAPLIRRTAA